VTVSRVDGVELLTDMVRIDSVSGGESRLAELLAERLASLGFGTRVDAAGNLIATWGDGDHHCALIGHLDTAPGHPPVRRDANRLFGRGTVDAKGPLAAAICAVSRQPRDGARRYTIVGAVEEESTSRGAHHLAAAMAPPHDLVILEPSGWEGVTIGYKGSVRAVWSVEQPAGHGAGPRPSAGDRAVAFVRATEDHARAWSGERGIFERLDVRVLSMHAAGDGITDRAHVDLGLRVPLPYDVAAAINLVRDAGRGARVDIVNVDPPVRTDRGSALARRFVSAIRDRGGSPRFKLKTGTSDMNVLVPAWRCPAVAYGPGDSRLDHTPDEHIDLQEFDRAVSVLEAALAA
jgi:[amino group carrier protein]-lysine/ornithine hydrolase